MAGSPVGATAMSALLDGYWYDAVAGLLETSLAHPDPPDSEQAPDLAYARNLAATARRVLDLDAEDFAILAAGFDTPWAALLAASSFPAEPRSPVRGRARRPGAPVRADARGARRP